jgi:hypothetical protein
MPKNVSESVPWLEDKAEIIILANPSPENFIFDLPTGRYRLDAGRRMRTVRSILNFAQVKALVDGGKLTVQDG